MDVRLNNHNGPVVALPQQLAAVAEQLQRDQAAWRERLHQDPTRFGEVEVTVHRFFQQLADQVVAGLLADVGRDPHLEDEAKKSD
jgi:hypothetical protein